MRYIYLKCFEILNRCGMCPWRTEARAVNRPRRAAAEARGFHPRTRSAAPSRLSHRLITGDLASLHVRSYDELFVYLVHRAHRRDVSLTRLAKGTLKQTSRDHSLVHCTLSKPAPNLTCDCLLELSVRVLCFIDNITCTTSRAYETISSLCFGCGVAELFKRVLTSFL